MNTVLYSKSVLALTLTIAFIFTVSRLVWLDLDPPLTKRIGDVANEGYWLHNARMKVLTGEFRHDPFNQALFTAPLYTLLAYGVFKAAGVSLSSGRLLAAWSGILVIVLGFLFLWVGCREPRWASAYALLLSINDLFFAYNRIGLIETTLNLFVLLSFIALAVAFQSSRPGWWVFLSGACFGFAFAVKFTALYVLVSFGVAAVLEYLAGNRRKFTELLVWIAGTGAAVAPFVLWMEWFYPGELAKYLGIYSPAAVGSGDGLYYRVVPLIFNPLRAIENEFVNSVSVTLLLLILLTYFAALYKQVGFRGLFGALSVFERLCLAWIVGNVVTAAYANLGSDRRYWGVLIPATVMVSKFVADCFGIGTVQVELRNAPVRAPESSVPGHKRLLKVLGGTFAMAYISAPLLVAFAGYTLRSAGMSLRGGVIQAGSLVVASLASLWAMAHRVRWYPWYVVTVPLVAFAIDWNLELLLPGFYVSTAQSMIWITVVALVVTFGLRILFQKGHRVVFGALFVAYIAWNGAVVTATFGVAKASVKSTAREIDRLITREEQSGRYYIAGANAYQLVLESESLPFYLGIGKFYYTDLTRGFLDYPATPRYYLHTLPPHARSASTAITPLMLPRGLEGREIGRYCVYEDRFTGYCRYPVAVVKLDRFSLSEFLQQANQAIPARR